MLRMLSMSSQSNDLQPSVSVPERREGYYCSSPLIKICSHSLIKMFHERGAGVFGGAGGLNADVLIRRPPVFHKSVRVDVSLGF